jgi:hypothetical protein
VRETVALVPASAHTALGSHVAFHADAPLRNRDWLGVSAKSGAEVIMTTLAAESRIRCLETRKLLANSRALIASSRRILNRAWEVGGSSGNDLHQTVRDRLVNGALFPVPRKAWGGHGTGHVCAVCDVSTSCAMTFGDKNQPLSESRPAPLHSLERIVFRAVPQLDTGR